jgi:hypothetical protein
MFISALEGLSALSLNSAVFEIVAPRFLVILENNFQGRLCMFYS